MRGRQRILAKQRETKCSRQGFRSVTLGPHLLAKLGSAAATEGTRCHTHFVSELYEFVDSMDDFLSWPVSNHALQGTLARRRDCGTESIGLVQVGV